MLWFLSFILFPTPNISFRPAAYQANDFFFLPLCTEITVFSQFGIFLNGEQTLKCILLVPEDITVAWCGVSLVFVLACWALLCYFCFFWKSLLHLFHFLPYLTFSFHADNFLCFTSPKTSSSSWIKHLSELWMFHGFIVLSPSLVDSISLAPVSEHALFVLCCT